MEQIGQNHVLHIPLPKTLDLGDQQTVWNQNWDAKHVGGYMVVRLTVSPDGAEMSDLNEEFLAEQIAAKQIDGRVTQEVIDRMA